MSKLNIKTRWVEKWNVPGSKPGAIWVVAKNNRGEYGCSCPVWKYKRKECKHIIKIKAQKEYVSVPVGKVATMMEKVSAPISKPVMAPSVFIPSERIKRNFNFDL